MSELINAVSPQVLFMLGSIFVVAGFVKGLSGFGMPMIAVPAATLLTGVPVTTAMGWSLGAIMATNLLEMILARRHMRVLARVWPLFAGLTLSMLFSVQLLAYLSSDVLSMIVGSMMLILVMTQLIRP